MKFLINTILFILIFHSPSLSFTDTLEHPVIGGRCPDFLLENVMYYQKPDVNLNDFKGKWLILDFWGEYCSSCIKAFPKVDKLQKKFGAEVQFLFVGVPAEARIGNMNPEESIRKTYEVHRKKLDLKVPIAFDKELASQFDLRAFPYILLIDPDGIVRYITSYLTEKMLEDVLNGIPVMMEPVYTASEQSALDTFDRNIPFLINNNGGKDTAYSYRSVFAKATTETPKLYTVETENRLEMLAFPISNLYQYVFFGKSFNGFHRITDTEYYGNTWPVAIVETKDQTCFEPIWETNEYLYSFGVHIKDDLKTFVNGEIFSPRNLLKKELELLLPYRPVIIKRNMPCYKIKVKQSKRKNLISQAKVSKIEFPFGYRQGFRAHKIFLSQVAANIENTVPDYEMYVPIIVDGKDFEIDLTLESVYFDDVVKELADKGIELKRTFKKMSVLVIQDI